MDRFPAIIHLMKLTLEWDENGLIFIILASGRKLERCNSDAVYAAITDGVVYSEHTAVPGAVMNAMDDLNYATFTP